jgi:hypothetical protein
LAAVAPMAPVKLGEKAAARVRVRSKGGGVYISGKRAGEQHFVVKAPSANMPWVRRRGLGGRPRQGGPASLACVCAAWLTLLPQPRCRLGACT